MTIGYMRTMIKRLYPSSIKWIKRVDRMPDKQVFTIYMRHKYANQI